LLNFTKAKVLPSMYEARVLTLALEKYENENEDKKEEKIN
jgi:hypothetical protein